VGCFTVSHPNINRRDQLELDGPDWDYAGFLKRDLEQYLRASAEFMAEAYGASGGG